MGEDQDDDTESTIEDSQFYTERVTHIVANIHERILHKVKLIRQNSCVCGQHTIIRGRVR